MKIGVIIDSFRTDFFSGIEKASQMGIEGIQLYAVRGKMAPENLNARQREEMLHEVRSAGMVFSAICGDPGGHGFASAADNPPRIAQAMRIMDLAGDLECGVVTSHIGVIPALEDHPRRKVLHDALAEIGAYGDQIGVRYAIETGPEPATVLDSFIRGLPCRGIGVNMDPANLSMVTGDDPVAAVRTLAPHIVHTHAKDGIMLRRTDPEIVYGFFAEGGIGDLNLDEIFREVPLGQGQVDFPAYLAALAAIGYDGYLTIEREVGEDPEKDIRDAAVFLKEKLAAMKG